MGIMTKLRFNYTLSIWECPTCEAIFEHQDDHPGTCPKSAKIFRLRRALLRKLEMKIATKLAAYKAHPEYISGVINSIPFDPENPRYHPTWKIEAQLEMWRNNPPGKILEGIGIPHVPDHNRRDENEPSPEPLPPLAEEPGEITE